MDLKNFLTYIIKEELLLDYSVIVTLFTVLKSDTDFIRITDLGTYAKIDGEEVLLDWVKKGESILDIYDIIELKSGVMKCLDHDVKTTIGAFMHNYLLVEYPFGGKIKYINTPFTVSDIENENIAPNIENEDSGDMFISVDELTKFVDATAILQNLASIFVVSSTRKTITPPPGNKAYRNKLIKEMKESKGEDALTNYANVAEIDKKLEENDVEYLKDDPTFGVMTSGKILKTARKKVYRMSGAEKGFKAATDKAVTIQESLAEGVPLTPENFAESVNSIRFGSFSRGAETVKGGVTGNIVLRVGASIVVDGTDCGVPFGSQLLVTNDNYKGLNQRYLIIKGELVFIKNLDNAKKYIGEIVNMRDPMYCRAEGVCKICGGKGLEINPQAVAAILTDISSIILNTSMKMMHSAVVKTVELDLDEAIS